MDYLQSNGNEQYISLFELIGSLTMGLKQSLVTAFLLVPLVLLLPSVSAEEGRGHKHDHDHDHGYRQHGVHVHGIAGLNLILEDKQLQLVLDSPAVNLLGFEHRPASDAEHASLNKAMESLKDGAHLFVFNAAADCRLVETRVSSALLETGPYGHDHRHSGDHIAEAVVGQSGGAAEFTPANHVLKL